MQYKLTAQSLMYKFIYVYMLTNYIIAIQYIRGYWLCNYPSEGQDHDMQIFVCNAMWFVAYRAMLKRTNEQIVLHNTYGKYCRLNCIDSWSASCVMIAVSFDWEIICEVI